MRTADGLLHYELSGEGHPVVLVHGVGASLQSWDDVTSALESSFQVLRVDLRGHGASAKIEGPYSADRFAQDVLSAMDAAGIVRAHLVGFSLGGLIAQKLAIESSERFDRLVILSAVAGRTDEERAKVVARLEMIRTGGVEAITGAAKDRWFTEAFALSHPGIIDRRIAELKAVHLDSYLEAYRVFGQTELVDSLHNIALPTLIMTGEFDQGSNVRMAETMHRLMPNSELRILPDLKHSILTEASDLVASHVAEFLGRSK